MCRGPAWRSLILVTGVTASIVVGGGAVAIFFFLPDVITEIERLGQGFDWVRGLSSGSRANAAGGVAVSVLALVPILFSVESCRKSFFTRKADGGCCASLKRCFQTMVGSWLVSLIELVLFLSIIWQLGVSYIYSFAMGVMFISNNVCADAGATDSFRQLVDVIENSNITTAVTEFFGDLDVPAYCTDYNTDAFTASRNVFGAAVACLLALIISFMSVGRAKEAIKRELSIMQNVDGQEVSFRLTEDQS